VTPFAAGLLMGILLGFFLFPVLLLVAAYCVELCVKWGAR